MDLSGRGVDVNGASKVSMLPLIVILASLVVTVLPGAVPAEVRLTILHTSEHHGTLQPIEDGAFKGFGGVARRMSLIEKVRNEADHVLLVDSGDLLVGTAMSSVFRGRPDITAMNSMGYDALAVGNHDFDFGIEHLKSLRKEAGFPFLCTNARPKASEVCERFMVRRVGPLRIGLLGLIGKRNYPDLFNPSTVRELEFQDPIAAAKAVAQELRGRVDLLVAITHQETEEDLALAKAVPVLNVIIGGHTPGFDGLVPPGQSIPLQGRVELTAPGPVFVKTHRQGRTLGRLDLIYDGRSVREAEGRNLPVDSTLPEESKVKKLVQDYTGRLEAVSNRVLGEALVDLEGESPEVRTQETKLGNLLADLARNYARTDIALVQSGSIRGSVPSGLVTLRKVMEVLPFDSPLISFTVTGKQLWEAMENSVSQLPKESGRFLQVSGLSYRFHPTAQIGSRVKEVLVSGIPLDSRRRYSVVVDQFLAEGGDGYTVFLQIQEKLNHQMPLRDILAAAVSSAPLTAKKEGRIQSLVSDKN